MSTLSNSFTAVAMWSLNPGGSAQGTSLVVKADVERTEGRDAMATVRRFLEGPQQRHAGS